MPRRRRNIHKTVPQVQPEASGGSLTIVRQSYGGRGVGSLHGLTVFVPRTAQGDVVDIRLVDQRRRYAVGEIIAIQEPSPWRVQVPCPLYDQCGGCHLQHLGYARQLTIKTAQVRDCLERLGKLPDVPVAPMLGSPLPFAYRNKVLYHYDRTTNALGLVSRQGHHVLDVPRCLISPPRADTIMARIRGLAAACPALGQILHQVQVQLGQRTGEALVTVIVHQNPAPNVSQRLWSALQDVATGLWLHIKTRRTPAVFSGASTALAGAEAIHERVGAQLFRIEPQAFFQVNTVQMERLYRLVRQEAALRGDEVVLDLYSGGGAIALTLAPYCREVYAVEVNRQATLSAMRQAAASGVTNGHFRTGKVERILLRYRAQGLRPNLAVLDPPRAGCRPEALQALAVLRVPRLVYVSCSPPTLARDLRRLHDLGYRTTRVQPLDMFPQTYHIECVASLSRSEHQAGMDTPPGQTNI
jgi:23S rRNA (uracil1939-C5)-methyltransferase